MVKRVFRIMYKEVRGLHQAAYVLAIFTFGSQILALLRDRILAAHFGAGSVLDIYYAAFKIPDLLYVLFASTLTVYVLIPFVAARVDGEDASRAQQLLSQVMSVFLIFYSALALLVFILAPYIVPYLFPGIEPHAVTLLLRILLLQPFFLGLSSLFGVVTQLGHRFILYSISPLIYNFCIILGIVVLYPYMGMSGLAWGVVIGAFGHMAIQIPLIRQSSFAFGFTTTIDWATMRDILVVSVPRAITLAMGQITLLALISLASTMTIGSVAIFQLAYNLQSVPVAVIGASYSIAAFPILADHYARGKLDLFRAHITTALRHIIFWCVPLVGLIVVLRAQIVRVVLGSGAFNWNDTRLTAAVLALLIISLVAQSVNLLITRTFYAGGYTKTPFVVAGAITVLTLSMAFLFTLLVHEQSVGLVALANVLRIAHVPGTEVILIAVSYSIGSLLQMAVLLRYAHMKFDLQLGWVPRFLAQAVAAAVIGGLCAYATLNLLVGGINSERLMGILLQGMVGGVAGTIGSIVTYRVLQVRELTEVYRALHGRLFRTAVVASHEDAG